MVTLDTQKAVTQLEDAGAPEPLARATVDVVEEGVQKGTEKLVTEATLYRALLIQGGVLLGAFAAVEALLG
ncbi:MAG: hypothetical protein F4Y97_07285 [Dehalococcoidia bacterium]|nr:hypothetical protein [Chloroflexota bacterium]MDE2933372.1 hypothetical protein [Chloroflexota bacterium]MXY72819.1 hypothetical protein [Dehalococcoidia bacterium]